MPILSAFRPSPAVALHPQRAIKDVEFHLRQALGSASKPGAGEEGQEVAQAAAEGLSLLLCQEGRDKEAAKVLKRRGFRLVVWALCLPV